LKSKTIALEYLKLIEDYFGHLFKAGPEEIDHFAIGEEYAGYRLLSNLISNSLADLGKDIKSFWDANGAALSDELRTLSGMKCLYSGDLSPQNALKLTKRTAMYVDTVLIPDPIYKIAVQLSDLKEYKDEYLPRILRHATNMYKLKDVLVADTEFPIVAIGLFGFESFDETQDRNFKEASATKFLDYCTHLFGYAFTNGQNAFDFLKHLETPEKIFNSVVDKNLLPPDLKTISDIEDFLKEYGDLGAKIMPGLSEMSVGQVFINYISSQTTRAVEHQILCGDYGACPIYDFDRPWFFMNNSLGAPTVDSGVVQALQTEKLEWLGNIPLEGIRGLREDSELEDFRQILRKGLHDIKVKRDANLTNTVETLQKNLSECFTKHSLRVDEIQKKVNKITNVNLPITTSAALLGLLPYGNLLSLPSTIRDVAQMANEVEVGTKDLSKLESSFINLLIKAKDDGI